MIQEHRESLSPVYYMRDIFMRDIFMRDIFMRDIFIYIILIIYMFVATPDVTCWFRSVRSHTKIVSSTYIAQLEEHWIVDQKVMASPPVSAGHNIDLLCTLCFCFDMLI